MIYMDNAATTWPKPRVVKEAVITSLEKFGANPGRGGHSMAISTAEQVYTCREAVANFFGLTDPAGVIFMPNCTAAINTVINGVVGSDGRVLISSLEHNAVRRPLHALSPRYPRYDVAQWSTDEDETVENFRRAITPQTRLLLCTHASNVFGVTLPIRRLADLAHKNGLLFCLDAAQTAGVLPIDMEECDIDYLCVAAHKGLYAPMGIGLLLCREQNAVSPLLFGGTGSQSLLPEQPRELPERLESGTPYMVGISGLLAGIRFVESVGRDKIYAHEIFALQRIYDTAREIATVKLYTRRPECGRNAPVLSLNIEGYTSEQLAEKLNKLGIAVRAGLHCAPLAHKHFGTLPDGTVRFSPSAFTSHADVEKICKVFDQFA